MKEKVSKKNWFIIFLFCFMGGCTNGCSFAGCGSCHNLYNGCTYLSKKALIQKKRWKQYEQMEFLHIKRNKA